jgi:hypothetical protein
MSTSEVLGDYLLDRLAIHGVRGRTVRLHRALGTQAACAELRTLLGSADLIVLAAPLYVDSLPSHVIAAMEMIAACVSQIRADLPGPENHADLAGPQIHAGSHGLLERRTGRRATAPARRFACLVNCGFPEAHQNETAIRVCLQFAREAGFGWAGGLGLGGGETIGGRPLGKIGGMVRHVIAALDLAGDALADGKAISGEAIALMAKPFMPAPVFRIAGDLFWRTRARQFGAQWRLHAQPYAEGRGVARG